MTFKHGKQAELWIGAEDVSTYFNSLDTKVEVDTAESTTFKSDWKSYAEGTVGAMLDAGGFYDPDFGTIRSLVGAQAGALVAAGPTGMTAVGDDARILTVLDSAYAESSPIGDMVAFNVSMLAAGRLGFGHVLHPLVEVTADANGSVYTGPVGGTTTGAIAQIHVTAITPGDTLDVTIEDSTNGSTGWSTIGTFTQVTAASAERIVIAGTVNRYLRAVWDVGGGGANAFTFGVILART